jgi:hypothetical protein
LGVLVLASLAEKLTLRAPQPSPWSLPGSHGKFSTKPNKRQQQQTAKWKGKINLIVCLWSFSELSILQIKRETENSRPRKWHKDAKHTCTRIAHETKTYYYLFIYFAGCMCGKKKVVSWLGPFEGLVLSVNQIWKLELEVWNVADIYVGGKKCLTGTCQLAVAHLPLWIKSRRLE